MQLEYLIGIGGYILFMLFLGYWVKNKINTAEDYLVGGRSFNTLFNTATVTSIALGGSVVVIVPGATYAYGIWNDELLWGSLINLAGGSIFLFIGAIFFMPKLWRLKLLSLGDFYYGRYSRATGILATVLISFTFIFWVAVQVLVFAKVAGSILDWPFLLSIFVSVTVICAYTLMGGLWGVQRAGAARLTRASTRAPCVRGRARSIRCSGSSCASRVRHRRAGRPCPSDRNP